MLEVLFIIAVLAVLCVLSFKDKGFTPPKTAPSDARVYMAYERAESLFVNRSEQAFFHTLRHALPSDFHLHSKVRLEDIVRVKKSIKGQTHWQLRGRVKSRHVDYLITNMEGVPMAAIELDGTSHNKAALNADMLKDGIFEAVGLPLIRVRSGSNYSQAARRVLSQIRYA
jgi:very-short-patch-repair endonuclease